MRISGTEPSSVILSQTMLFKKLKSDDPKVLKCYGHRFTYRQLDYCTIVNSYSIIYCNQNYLE